MALRDNMDVYNAYQRARWNARTRQLGLPMVKCLICGGEYRQVGTHVYQSHKISMREYKLEFGLDRKRGILPEDLRRIKAEHVFENDTVKNLERGRKYWFKRGSKTAGKYVRSRQTMERLRKLHTINRKVK